MPSTELTISLDNPVSGHCYNPHFIDEVERLKHISKVPSLVIGRNSIQIQVCLTLITKQHLVC